MVMEMSFLHVDMSFYKFDGNVNNELWFVWKLPIDDWTHG